MKAYITKYLLTIIGILSASIAIAQGPPPQTPIDGGLSLLLAAGGAYGVKKLIDQKRK